MNDNSQVPAHARGPRLRERMREAATEAILAAAEEVFSRDGLHAARMEQIAARAGVAVGTLYNHFEDRQALVAELVQLRRRDLLARLEAALAGADGAPFDERLRRFVAALLEHADQHGRLLVALTAAGEGPAQKGNGVLATLEARAAALMARGVEEGALRPEHAELYAPVFVSMARAMFLRDLGRTDLAAPAERAAAVVDFFLRGGAR